MSALRVALRVYIRRPALSLVIVSALGVGLGAALAAFTLVDRVLLRKPALPDSDRVVVVSEIDPKAPEKPALVSPADFLDWSHGGAFRSAGAWMKWSFTLTGTPMPQRLRGALVSGEYFGVLARPAALGRTLIPADARDGHDDVVVISDRLWREAFNRDPAMAGRRILLNGSPVEVAGVMPAGFRYPDDDIDVWTPIVFGKSFARDDRAGRNLRVIARLRPGVSPAAATSLLDVMMKRTAALSPKTHAGWRASVTTLHDDETRALRPTVTLLFAAAAAMLLVAVANVVNLLMMLAAARSRELATRLALGARRMTLLRQSVLEGALAGAVSGGLALVIAAALLAAMRSTSGELLRAESFELAPHVAILGVVAALAIGIASAVGAMLLASRADLVGAIRASHQLSSTGGRFRGVLVVTQIALATAVLVAAGVLLQSFRRLTAVDPGFDRSHLLTAQVWLPSAYKDPVRQLAFFRDVTARLGALPGVSGVATVQDLPLKRNAMTFDVTLDDGRLAPGAYRVVSDGYFGLMRIPLLRGRGFTPRDDERAARVVIVNRAFAVRAFGSSDPIGRRLRIGGEGSWATVAGVAGDVKQMGLAEEEVPAVYQPLPQKQFDFLRWNAFVIRTTTPASPELVAAIRAEVRRIDPDQPLYEIRTVDAIVEGELTKPRLAASVVSGLGGVALFVALIGIAGVLSYAVALRTREFGIRMALGARPADVVTLVLRHAARLAAAGIGAGLLVALAGSPLLDRLLFQVAPVDGAVYATVAITLLTVAIAAALVPARRAAGVDPALMLRAE
jgi:putative ABC transport system permease protein